MRSIGVLIDGGSSFGNTSAGSSFGSAIGDANGDASTSSSSSCFGVAPPLINAAEEVPGGHGGSHAPDFTQPPTDRFTQPPTDGFLEESRGDPTGHSFSLVHWYMFWHIETGLVHTLCNSGLQYKFLHLKLWYAMEETNVDMGYHMHHPCTRISDPTSETEARKDRLEQKLVVFPICLRADLPIHRFTDTSWVPHEKTLQRIWILRYELVLPRIWLLRYHSIFVIKCIPFL